MKSGLCRKINAIMFLLSIVLIQGCSDTDDPFRELLKKTGFRIPGHSDSRIPDGRDVQVNETYKKQKYDLFYRHFVRWYKNSSASSGDYNEETARFLDEYCHYKACDKESQSWKSLLEKAEKITENPSSPAIARFCHAKLLHRDKQTDRAEKLMGKLMAEMESSGHPHIHSYLVRQAMKELLSERMSGVFTEKNECEKKSAQALCMALASGEFSAGEMRTAFELVDCSFSDDNLEIIINGLKSSEKTDPWLMNMIEGIYHISKAWRWRGSGWANEVTDDGHKEFLVCLEKAENSLEKAYELKPDFPEAAECMITVVMGKGGKPGKSERYWFDRAVAAEMDYTHAYERYLWSLRPRWGGSHEKMIRFAEECLETGRFDTDVPWIYLATIREIGKEAPHNRWKAIFRTDGVERNLRILFDGMMSEPSRKHDLDRISAQKANVLLWQGNYEEAGKIVASLDSNFDMTEGFTKKALSWSGRSLKTIITEIELFTGKHAELMKQAETSNLKNGNDNVQKACGLYRQVMDANRDTPRTYRFLQELIVSTMNDSIDFAFYEDQELLFIVAQRNRPDIVKFLLETGADVNSEEKKSRKTPLHAAACKGNTEVCELLLEKGAEINRKDYGGDTPLSLALDDNRHEAALFLLDKGADGNTVNLNRWTPLHLAIYGRDQDIASRLINLGVDINPANDQGWTPLCLALRYGQPDIARLLIEKGAALKGQNKGLIPLHIAIGNHHDELAISLIYRGVDINSVNEKNASPLHVAIESNKPEMIKLLIDKGADLKAETKEGWTPLEMAVWNGLQDIAITIINKGSDIKKICPMKKATVLHMAAVKNLKDVVQLLIEKGADINARDEDGKTPFDLAQQYNNLETARVILAHIEKKEYGIKTR